MAKETSKNIEEEIDLLALFESLWKERVLIVVISVIITLFGLGSTFVIPPTYEAEVKLLPPSILDIVELKKFDAHENEPRNKPTPTEIFTEFLGTLKSKQLQQKFLEQEGVMKYLFEKDITQVKALDLFDRMIGIHESNIKTNGFLRKKNNKLLLIIVGNSFDYKEIKKKDIDIYYINKITKKMNFKFLRNYKSILVLEPYFGNVLERKIKKNLKGMNNILTISYEDSIIHKYGNKDEQDNFLKFDKKSIMKNINEFS